MDKSSGSESDRPMTTEALRSPVAEHLRQLLLHPDATVRNSASAILTALAHPPEGAQPEPEVGGTCNVCGGPLRYGARHHDCGRAVMAAEMKVCAPLEDRIHSLLGDLGRANQEIARLREKTTCQYGVDVGMPEHRCADQCQYAAYAEGRKDEAAEGAQTLPAAGWKLVPIEPTEDMLFAAEVSKPRGYVDLYKAMLAAAPGVPSDLGAESQGDLTERSGSVDAAAPSETER